MMHKNFQKNNKKESNYISLKKNSMLLNLNCKSKQRLKSSNYFFLLTNNL